MKRASEHMRQRARELRKTLTLSEHRLWGWLRNRTFRGYKFRRQVAVEHYVLDFYCAALKLAIEVDGAQHSERAIAESDVRRTTKLGQLGIRVVRIENVVVAKDPIVASQMIEVAVEERAAERARTPIRAE